MADNIVANSGSGGLALATDNIGGVHYPRSKLIHGPDGTNDGDVSTANPLPVQIRSNGTFTNRSGSITAGGTSQTLAASNTSRRYLLLQNKVSAAESFWVRLDGTAAVTDSPSIEVAPGVTLIFEGTFIPTGQVNVIATTTGTKFTAAEG